MSSDAKLLDVLKNMLMFAKTFENEYGFHFTERKMEDLEENITTSYFPKEQVRLSSTDKFAWWGLYCDALLC